MRRQWIIGIVVSLFAISLTWIVTDVRLYQFATATSLAIAMLGLNMLTGYNGQISLGHGAFMGLGAYTGAILVRDQGMSYPLVIVVAFVVCFIVGALDRHPGAAAAGHEPGADHAGAGAGVPAGAQEVRLDQRWRPGHQHAARPAVRTRRGTASRNDQFRYLFCVGIAILLFWLAWNIVRGRWGLAMMSVRDNPVSAASMGVNLASTKVVTFAISAGYAGVGGALSGILVGYISPESITLAISIAPADGHRRSAVSARSPAP